MRKHIKESLGWKGEENNKQAKNIVRPTKNCVDNPR